MFIVDIICHKKDNNNLKTVLPCHHTLASAILLEQCMQVFPLLILVVNEELKTDEINIIRYKKAYV